MEACSVAIYDALADAVLAEVHDVPGRGHAEILFAQIEHVTRSAGITLRDMDRFAVTVGPGSFTGVRTGLAAARGFALATGCPAIGVGSLEAIAAAAQTPSGERLAVVQDARRGEFYVQIFAHGRALGPPAIMTRGGAAAAIGDVAFGGAGIALVGSGADALVLELGASVRVLKSEPWPRASVVARIAGARPPGGSPAPFYLRAPDAKLPLAAAP
jgi:tRNA threonylcarbamoyl adenosine modification protein YeaZ